MHETVDYHGFGWMSEKSIEQHTRARPITHSTKQKCMPPYLRVKYHISWGLAIWYMIKMIRTTFPLEMKTNHANQKYHRQQTKAEAVVIKLQGN